MFTAGTDAKVYIKLFGTIGKSEEIELKDDTNRKERFESGRCI